MNTRSRKRVRCRRPRRAVPYRPGGKRFRFVSTWSGLLLSKEQSAEERISHYESRQNQQVIGQLTKPQGLSEGPDADLLKERTGESQSNHYGPCGQGRNRS